MMPKLPAFKSLRLLSNSTPSSLETALIEISKRPSAIVISFIIWTLLISSNFYLPNWPSQVQIFDNADAYLSFYKAFFSTPDRALDSGWISFCLCGVDRSAYFPGPWNLFYWILSVFQDTQVAYVALMLLQRFIASYFTFRVCRDLLKFGNIASISAGMLYSVEIFFCPLTEYHLLAEPGLPLFIWTIDQICNIKYGIKKYIVILLTGILFGMSSSIYFATPFLLVAITFWFLFVSARSMKEYWYIIFIMIVMVLIVNYPNIIRTMDIKNETQRFLLPYSFGPKLEFDAFIQSAIESFNRLLKLNGRQNALFVAIFLLSILFGSWNSRRFKLFAGLYLGLFIFNGVLTSILENLPIISNIGKGFNFRRFDILLPFLSVLSIASFLDYVKSNSLTLKQQEFTSKVSGALILASTFLILSPYILYLYGKLRDFQLSGVLPSILSSKQSLLLIMLVVLMTWMLYVLFRILKNPGLAIARVSLTFKLAPAIIAIFIGIMQVVSPRIDMDWRYANYDKIYNREEIKTIAATFSPSDPFRVATAYATVNNFHPGFLIGYGLETVDGYVNLYAERYLAFWKRVVSGLTEKYPEIKKEFSLWGARVYLYGPGAKKIKQLPSGEAESFRSLYNLDLLSLANVRYLISPIQINDERLLAVTENEKDNLFIYRNMECLPRWFVVSQSRIFANRDALLDSLANSNNKDLWNNVFFEENRMPDNAQAISRPDTIIIQNTIYSSDKISFNVESSGESFMVLTNTYSKFWKVSINGVESVIYPVDGVFQGIELPKGTSEVVFHYDRKFIKL